MSAYAFVCRCTCALYIHKTYVKDCSLLYYLSNFEQFNRNITRYTYSSKVLLFPFFHHFILHYPSLRSLLNFLPYLMPLHSNYFPLFNLNQRSSNNTLLISSKVHFYPKRQHITSLHSTPKFIFLLYEICKITAINRYLVRQDKTSVWQYSTSLYVDHNINYNDKL